MSCEQWSEAVSALVDGEDPGVDPGQVQSHLDTCPSCRTAAEQMIQLRRVARVQPATPMPDLSARVVKSVALADRAGRWMLLRVLLAVVAVYVLGLSFIDLFWPEGQGADMHAGRHLGAFTLAYGIALVVVVARPARARTVLPVACTLGLVLAVTAAVDVAAGTIPLTTEGLHLPELASVLLLWLLAAPARERGGTGAGSAPATSVLRLVTPTRDDQADREAPAG